MQRELLHGQTHDRVGAQVAGVSDAEHHWRQRRELDRSSGGCPRDQLLSVVQLGCGENRARQRGLGFPSVGRRRDDRERAPADPGATALVADYRTPSTATSARTGRSASHRH
jgi:hypothetical protein